MNRIILVGNNRDFPRISLHGRSSRRVTWARSDAPNAERALPYPGITPDTGGAAALRQPRLQYTLSVPDSPLPHPTIPGRGRPWLDLLTVALGMAVFCGLSFFFLVLA